MGKSHRIIVYFERSPTKRALDVWDSAAFSRIFLASSFSCSLTESAPAYAQVTQTVQRHLAQQKKNRGEMDQFDEYERYRTTSLLALRAFPRSIGMMAGAITLLRTQDPFTGIQVCLTAWFITFWVKSIFLGPSIVDFNLWSGCSLPVMAIGAYPVRWLLYITMVIIGLFMGAPFMATLMVMGGLLFYDFIIIFTRGS